ncbi:hypothetical protein PSPO01_01767 [Paraphaeosphaeria sporulosa]
MICYRSLALPWAALCASLPEQPRERHVMIMTCVCIGAVADTRTRSPQEMMCGCPAWLSQMSSSARNLDSRRHCTATASMGVASDALPEAQVRALEISNRDVLLAARLSGASICGRLTLAVKKTHNACVRGASAAVSAVVFWPQQAPAILTRPLVSSAPALSNPTLRHLSCATTTLCPGSKDLSNGPVSASL